MFLAVGSHPAPEAQTTVTAQIAQMCAARLVISSRKFRDANSVNIGQRTDGVPAAWRGNLPFLRTVSTSNRARYFSKILRGNAHRGAAMRQKELASHKRKVHSSRNFIFTAG